MGRSSYLGWRGNVAVSMKPQVVDCPQLRFAALCGVVLMTPPGLVELVILPGMLVKEASGCLE